VNDKFILGGYYVVKAAHRALCMDQDLLPERILTVSECICDNIPGSWDIKRADSIKSLLHWRDKELADWAAEQLKKGNVEWPYGFADIATARAFCARFLKDTNDIYLLGIGLSKEDADYFISEEKPTEVIGASSVYNVLSRIEYIDTTDLLGFDVLGCDMGFFHSYICNSLASDLHSLFSMKPNEYGFYDSYDKAKQAAQYLLNEGSHAEPALWQAWAVCRFEL
jgi:hypothetical protein